MYIKRLTTLLILVMAAYSCSKVKEAPELAGKPVDYVEPGLRSLKAILDSVPNISIYKTAYQKSQVQHYIDSVRQSAGKADAAFTLFVPKDAAFQAAGYSLSTVQGMSTSACDRLLMYLTVSGRILPQHNLPVAGGSMLFPVIKPGRFPVDINGSIIDFDHFYSLHLAWAENAVFLNGIKIGAGKDRLAASDGAVYLCDSLIKKPEHTVYELLAADTTYSFYLAALEKSNALYQQYKAGISPGDRNEEFLGFPADPFMNYLSRLKTFNPNSRYSDNRFFDAYMVFAPENNAFRKAGMADIEAVEQYIGQSYITTPAYRDIDHAIPMYTNLDSILRYSFLAPVILSGSGAGIAFNVVDKINNIHGALLYTPDLRRNNMLQEDGVSWTQEFEFYDWTSFDENIFDWTIIIRRQNKARLKFLPAGDRIMLKRGDLSGGRASYIIPEHSNVTALNGVIHRIDNLLLPTP